MAKGLRKWTVFPHGALERMSPSVMTVTGDIRMPLTTLERRMTLARLSDGRLVVYGAIALAEDQMGVLEGFGSPAFLVVPSHLHRNDAFIWKQRYPDLIVVAPSAARSAVAEVVAVDTCTPDFGDDAVRFVEVAGAGGREAALEILEGGRSTLVLNDIVGNLPKSSGFVLRALGFAADRPRVPRALRGMLVKDAGALRRQFEAWAAQAVERILVSHGRPILADAQHVLRDLGNSL